MLVANPERVFNTMANQEHNTPLAASLSINEMASTLPNNKYKRKIIKLAQKTYELLDHDHHIGSIGRNQSHSHAGSSVHGKLQRQAQGMEAPSRESPQGQSYPEGSPA